MRKLIQLSLVISALALLPACGVLIGNTKPVVERSETYEVADLTKLNSKWVRLGSAERPESGSGSLEEDAETSDLAYKATDTDSIIALNSACRPKFANTKRDLRSFTQQLLLGLNDVSERSEKPIEVDRNPGLETTARGMLNGGKVKMKMIVVQRGPCIYDLMYLSDPEKFPTHQEDFNHFVSTLRLR